MEALAGVFIWIIRGICWIVLGVLTFNWIDVDSFVSAILWLFVWHLATMALSWILVLIIVGVAANE